MERVRINIKGVVQGVGFRPFIYNLAKLLNLKGYVTNTADGVDIDIEGEDVIAFIDRLPKEAPPLSEIKNINISPMPFHGYEDFEILKSSDRGGFTLISPDVSVCDDCLKEMFDKDNRRYLYPFINCTNCGPRYTITNKIPYDRPNTTMAAFKMCPECEAEYNDPNDRRFHAQPNACAVCGPHVELRVKRYVKDKEDDPSPIPLPLRTQADSPRRKEEGVRGREEDTALFIGKKDPIAETIRLLKQGAIVAVKGLGGFHIACDATNKDAVERLRLRKRKSNKPFALMSPDIETIEKYCVASEEEKRLLNSNKRPIVLLRKKTDCAAPLTEAVSPNNQYLGFMLPYTPLHYLLFFYPVMETYPHITPLSMGGYNFDALIMTSGNLSEEPIVIDNDEATSKLSDIADAFLLHDRDIFMRTDDSVVRYHSAGARAKTLFIRRSRGYVPDVITFDNEGPEVLGCGADIKNIFTLTKGNYAIPSQHIGDMENYETLKFFEESLENLKMVYRVNPVAIAYDLHPNYLSTKWALSQAQPSAISRQQSPPHPPLGKGGQEGSVLLYGIQHHYAHIASVMAEHGIKRKVIGVAFDGTGYGADGNLWGSEFLIADIEDFKRAGHFKYIPLPGGETAIKEPWRTAISYMKYIAGDEAIEYLESIGFIEKYGKDQIENILRIIDNKDFSPLASGAGRLFDAISAMLGICDKNTFEGEAAMALESYTIEDIYEDYPVDIIFRDVMNIDFSMTILRIIEDIKKNIGKDIIAAKFHNTVVTAITRVVQKLSALHRLYDVVLSGGVFQNMYLLKNAMDRLKSIGMNIYINEKVPANDAGISLGQAYIVRERLKTEGWRPKK